MRLSVSNYVMFRLSGRNISRFISRCAANGVELISVKHSINEKTPTIIVKLRAAHVKSMLKTAGECRLKVKTLERNGIGFFVRKNKLRWVLMIGWVIASVFIALLSHFVFFIEVEGIYRIDEEHMKELLEEVGINRFMYIDRTEINEKAEELRTLDTDIGKASITVQGVKLTVTIQETIKDGFADKEKEFNNIYAVCDGVIENILTYSGRAMVKKGDVVKKGDILISGDLSTEEKSILVQASGKVTAQVAHTFYGTAGPKVTARVRSGNKIECIRLEFFGIGTQKTIFQNYELEYTEKNSALTNMIPIKVKKVIAYELRDGFRDAEESELYMIAEEKAEKAMIEGLDKNARVISKSTGRETLPSGEVNVVISVITEENIGRG